MDWPAPWRSVAVKVLSSSEAGGLLILLPRLSFPLILGGKGHHSGGRLAPRRGFWSWLAGDSTTVLAAQWGAG